MTTLCVVTDAWSPQVNGVVTVLNELQCQLSQLGVQMDVIHPGMFKTVPAPGYQEIPLVINPWRVMRIIRAAQPQAIHIATEGPLGLAARIGLKRAGIPFTTAMHSKFPEYVALRTGLPVPLGYRALRWFHDAAERTFVQSASQQAELVEYGFENLVVVGGGVNPQRFRPLPRLPAAELRLLFVGRLAVEKGIEDFLSLDTPAHKVVVGNGPARADLQRRYPHVEFRGYQHGDALVSSYAEADAFVFPSRTDTFGLVLAEAMACGTPVAAYPVTGPYDVVREGISGALDEDLAAAVRRALTVDRAKCRAFALQFSWINVAKRFLQQQAWIDVAARRARTA